MYDSYDSNFDAPDAYFDNLHVCLLSDAQVKKIGNWICMTVKTRGKNPNSLP
jgi:hypothetical protein